MKTKIVLAGAITVMMSMAASAQCWTPAKANRVQSSSTDEIVSGALEIDFSLKQYEPSGFYGFGLFGGIWADPHSEIIPTLGVLAGYSETKLSADVPTTSSLALMISFRKDFLNDRLTIVGHFAAGTQNYQDIGLRVAYDILNDGIAVGLLVSRTMHYGITFTVNMKSKK